MKQVKVKNKKNLFQAITGIMLIVLTFIANGFLSFITIGFDFKNICSPYFWAQFGILFLSEMLVLFGMFLIQKIKDLQNKKIVDLQEHINKKRNVVYGVDKISEAQEWLRTIYNYTEKLNLYEEKIKDIFSKTIVKEVKPNCRFYKQKQKHYLKMKNKQEFCLEQLKLIKNDRERIKLLIESSQKGIRNEKIDELDKLLTDDKYGFRTAKIHYREVYWANLVSDSQEDSVKDATPFFNEKKEISKNIISLLGKGAIVSGFLTSLTSPLFKSVSIATAITLLMTTITLMMYMLRGIKLSNKIILGTYYNALEKRKTIYNQMLKDLGISRIVIEEDDEETNEKDLTNTEKMI